MKRLRGEYLQPLLLVPMQTERGCEAAAGFMRSAAVVIGMAGRDFAAYLDDTMRAVRDRAPLGYM